ncbi:MAG: L-lactate dehydrogenase [Candidatus Kerfeldbacteria bacterium]|nr:L-lactate dehydrogenase [Candidatus Kerfeldbacteria bacterium]
MPGKVSIIGAGNVGTASAFALALDGAASDIVLLDRNLKKAEGEVLDLMHGSSFLPYTNFKGSKNYRDIQDSDIVVITAGAAQAPGQTRLDLLTTNLKILHGIVTEVKRQAPHCIMLIVTNPVDILTYFAKQYSGFPHHHVIGSGTVLDTARFRAYLAQHFKVSPHHVDAYVLGEHGNSSFPVISTASVQSVPLTVFPGYHKSDIQRIHAQVVQVVYDIIKKKGATNLAIGVCVTQLVRAILYNTHEVYPVSSVLRGEYGIHDVAVSTPSVLGKRGIEKELVLPLNQTEKTALRRSVAILKRAIRSVH